MFAPGFMLQASLVVLGQVCEKGDVRKKRRLRPTFTPQTVKLDPCYCEEKLQTTK